MAHTLTQTPKTNYYFKYKPKKGTMLRKQILLLTAMLSGFAELAIHAQNAKTKEGFVMAPGHETQMTKDELKNMNLQNLKFSRDQLQQMDLEALNYADHQLAKTLEARIREDQDPGFVGMHPGRTKPLKQIIIDTAQKLKRVTQARTKRLNSIISDYKSNHQKSANHTDGAKFVAR